MGEGMARTCFQVALELWGQFYSLKSRVEFQLPREELGGVPALARIVFGKPLAQVRRVATIKLLWVGDALEDIGVKHTRLINGLNPRVKVRKWPAIRSS